MINLEQTVDNLFRDINAIRTKPRDYAQNLVRKQSLYMNDIYKPKGKYIQTKEGVRALRDACVELQRIASCQPLTWSFALHVLADQQALYIGANGLTKGDRPLSERVPKYAVASGRINQIIELGGTSSQQIYHQLIVDDGLATRRRRKTLLDPNYKYVGIAVAKHKVYGYCTVMIFAQQIHELLKPTQQLVQLEVQKHKKQEIVPGQNYYKMKKPPQYNQVKHFKKSQVIVPPPPVTTNPLNTSQTFKRSQVLVPAITPQFVAPNNQQQIIVQETYQPVPAEIIVEPTIVEAPNIHMTTSFQPSQPSIPMMTTAPMTTFIPEHNAEVILQARSSSQPGLVITPPPMNLSKMSNQDYRGTIIHPPQHVQLVNRLSQYRPPELTQTGDVNQGIFDRCSGGKCLLF